MYLIKEVRLLAVMNNILTGQCKLLKALANKKNKTCLLQASVQDIVTVKDVHIFTRNLWHGKMSIVYFVAFHLSICLGWELLCFCQTFFHTNRFIWHT